MIPIFDLVALNVYKEFVLSGMQNNENGGINMMNNFGGNNGSNMQSALIQNDE